MVFQTAGRLVNNSIAAEELELLSAVIAKHFVKVLQTEVHEKTLITTLQRMSPWCSNFKTFIPENISSVLLVSIARNFLLEYQPMLCDKLTMSLIFSHEEYDKLVFLYKSI